MKELSDLMMSKTERDIQPPTDPSCVRDKADVSRMYGCFGIRKEHGGREPGEVFSQSMQEMLG